MKRFFTLITFLLITATLLGQSKSIEYIKQNKYVQWKTVCQETLQNNMDLEGIILSNPINSTKCGCVRISVHHNMGTFPFVLMDYEEIKELVEILSLMAKTVNESGREKLSLKYISLNGFYIDLWKDNNYQWNLDVGRNTGHPDDFRFGSVRKLEHLNTLRSILVNIHNAMTPYLK